MAAEQTRPSCGAWTRRARAGVRDPAAGVPRYTARLGLREANRCCGTVCRIHGGVAVPPQRSSSMIDTGTTFIRRISMSHRLVRPQTTRQSAPAWGSRAEDSRAAERQRPSGRGPRARERRLQARLAQQPMPTNPTGNACARRAFRGTRVVARRNALSGSSSITPSGPARPFRLARVPRPGMTNTNVRLGTHRPHSDVRSADRAQPQHQSCPTAEEQSSRKEVSN